jgi:DNA-binding GntR family transcriptional regulator
VSTVIRPDARSIYAALRADIAGGTLPAGSPVREVAVAARFGVSRTPVREALRRLQHDGLLVPSGRGLEVRGVDPGEVVQVYDLRILLEAEAAAQAARAHGPADLVRLEGLLARHRALTDPDDATRTGTNLDFHAALWRAAHNPVLEDLLHRLAVHAIRAPHSTLSVPGRWPEALDEHADLIEAIRARDEAAARRLAGDHLRTARELRLALLRDLH